MVYSLRYTRFAKKKGRITLSYVKVPKKTCKKDCVGHKNPFIQIKLQPSFWVGTANGMVDKK